MGMDITGSILNGYLRLYCRIKGLPLPPKRCRKCGGEVDAKYLKRNVGYLCIECWRGGRGIVFADGCRVCGGVLDANYQRRHCGYLCLLCYRGQNRRRAKEYYKKHPDRVRQTVKKSEGKHPGRQACRAMSHYYYPKSQICSVAGCLNDGERHHPDYTNAKIVGWFCSLHHKQLHNGVLTLSECGI